MPDHGYWTGCATSIELGIEGQQLLAREIMAELRALWQRLLVRLPALGQSLPTVPRQHPPI